MTKVVLGNAFSLQMLDLTVGHLVKVEPITAEEVAAMEFESVVGHKDTAAVLSTILGKEVAFNRATVGLGIGGVIIVAQLTGGRLPEGATTLPEGFSITFVKVTVGSIPNN